jgi:hypothetical protein
VAAAPHGEGSKRGPSSPVATHRAAQRLQGSAQASRLDGHRQLWTSSSAGLASSSDFRGGGREGLYRSAHGLLRPRMRSETTIPPMVPPVMPCTQPPAKAGLVLPRRRVGAGVLADAFSVCANAGERNS